MTPDVGAKSSDFLAPPQLPELGRLGPFRVLAVLGAGDVKVERSDPARGEE
jgi:hypothetical protein